MFLNEILTLPFCLSSKNFTILLSKVNRTFFTSIYVFARYCPTIPRQNSCTPLIKEIMHTRDGQPDTGSPNISVLMTIK